jgi:hypothetical protein
MKPNTLPSEPDGTAVQPQRAYALDRYRPAEGWFRHAPRGVHGIGHAARVLVWANALAATRRWEGYPVDLEVVRWAAALHDVGRVDDWVDADHGRRSAEWIREGPGRAWLLAAGLAADQTALVAHCCAWHADADRAIPAPWPLELAVLKDADGLDRHRLGDLDPRYLRSESAKDLVRQAQRLVARSVPQEGESPWDAVRRAALALGVWA